MGTAMRLITELQVRPNKTTGRTLFCMVACCLASGGCFHHLPPHAGNGTALRPGTYALEICRGSCRGSPSDSVLAKGRLVIEEKTFTIADLPPGVRDYIVLATDLLTGPARDLDPNACFELKRTRADLPTYAGTEPVGFTVVEHHRQDSVRVALFRSPDASYYAVLAVAGVELRGRGRSSGIGDAAVRLPQDSVHARRVGPPDRGLCIRAAEAAAAELEARRSPPRP